MKNYESPMIEPAGGSGNETPQQFAWFGFFIVAIVNSAVAVN